MVEDREPWTLMPLARLKVIEVMSRSDLYGAGPKLEIDENGIADDGNVSSRQRQVEFPADEVAITGIVGMHGDGRVAQHGFRTCGRDNERRVGVSHERIADVIELTFCVFMLHFDVGQGR